MNEKEFEFIREFRGVSYPQEKDWQNFLSNQATNTVYVEHLAILCTAYFLGVEICVTTETCHKERPYFSYNRDSHSEISLWVANYQNCHFQSLIPTNDSVMNYEISKCLLFTTQTKTASNVKIPPPLKKQGIKRKSKNFTVKKPAKQLLLSASSQLLKSKSATNFIMTIPSISCLPPKQKCPAPILKNDVEEDNTDFTVSTNSKLLEDTKKQKDVLEYDANIKKDCFITLPVSTTLPSKKKEKPNISHESETINDPVTANIIEMIHQNPDVGSSIISFIQGEKKTFF